MSVQRGGKLMATVKAVRSTGDQLTFYFLFSPRAVPWNGVTHIHGGSSYSVNLISKPSHRHAQSLASWPLLGPFNIQRQPLQSMLNFTKILPVSQSSFIMQHSHHLSLGGSGNIPEDTKFKNRNTRRKAIKSCFLDIMAIVIKTSHCSRDFTL